MNAERAPLAKLASVMGRMWSSASALGVAGIVAAAVLLVCSNVLVHRFYARWDWTTRGLYTLSYASIARARQRSRCWYC